MGVVIDLDRARRACEEDDEPSLMIDCTRLNGAVHVYPVEYFHALVRGDEGLEPLPPDVLRKIVQEWMTWLVLDDESVPE